MRKTSIQIPSQNSSHHFRFVLLWLTALTLVFTACTADPAIPPQITPQPAVTPPGVTPPTITPPAPTVNPDIALVPYVYDDTDYSWSDAPPSTLSASRAAIQVKPGNNDLSTLTYTSATNGWGPLEKNQSNGGRGVSDGHPLTLDGKVYSSGLGVHAASAIKYNLDGQCTGFQTDIGVDDEVRSLGSVTFEIWADGVNLFKSAVITGSTPQVSRNVDVTGKKELKLVVTKGGDSIDYDHADWAGAVLTGCTPTPTDSFKRPPSGKVSWDLELGADLGAGFIVPSGVTLLDIDGFGATASLVADLKKKGIYTVCYLNGGSYEPFRPDSAQYPEYLKVQQDPDWPDEYFLDVTDVFKPNSVLAKILRNRIQMCKQKGFDAIDPDNLQNDQNVTDGSITTPQQIDFNGWVADTAHGFGLAAFQKNGPDKVLMKDRTGKMMVEKFDGILNEQCQEYDECTTLEEFSKRGKLTLNVEYRAKVALNCSLFNTLQINSLKKDLYLVGVGAPGYKRETCN
jgi:hypothetical protein